MILEQNYLILINGDNPKGRLISLDIENRKLTFSYDEYGNCTNYNGNVLIWNKDRLLSKVRKNNNDIITYNYDCFGNRTEKSITLDDSNYSSTYEYYYDLNGKLIFEDRGYNKIKYNYDITGLNGFTYYQGENSNTYIYLKDVLGNIFALVDESTSNIVAYYEYDAWGEHRVWDNTNSINTNANFIGNINPFRYRGYYYDEETGLAMVGQRYYSPEICRFIQPADVSTLNPSSINGLNLYSYANNNPIVISKLTNRTHATLHNGSMMTHIVPSLNKFTSGISASSKNYWNPHWENKWFDTDWPGFFVLSQEGFEVVNWSLSIYKGSLYFDNNENHSLYIAAGNIGVYAGINYKEGIGIDVGASVLEIGYDGRIIDASIEGLTIGITYMYKDGKFEFGYGAGWFGWSVSIDFVELFKLLFGGE